MNGSSGKGEGSAVLHITAPAIILIAPEATLLALGLLASMPLSAFLPSRTVFFSSFGRSEEWQKVSNGEREKLGMTVEDDGEFW